MSPRTVGVAVAIGLAVTALGVLLEWRSPGDPPAGPFAVGNPGGVSVVARALHEPFAVGEIEVQNPANEPAVLDHVYITGAMGGMRLVHVYTALIPQDAREGAWAVTKIWPPPGEKLRELGAIDAPPHSDGPDGPAVQLMLELVLDRPGRGLLRSVVLDYHIGHHRYRAEFPFSVSACYPKPRGGCAPPRLLRNGPESVPA